MAPITQHSSPDATDKDAPAVLVLGTDLSTAGITEVFDHPDYFLLRFGLRGFGFLPLLVHILSIWTSLRLFFLFFTPSPP